MNNKILSIAVPSYNMEKYLNKCLDSFLVPEILDDIEVIVVNDGSKDNTLKIAKEYEEKYPNVFKVIDKENGGHGSGINHGVKNAVGTYFKLIDADDWVDSSNMIDYVNMLKQHQDVDMFVNNYNQVFEPDYEIKDANALRDIKVKNQVVEFFEYEFKPMHCLTYRTDILRNFTFSEKCFYEDTEYASFPLLYVGKIYFSDLNIYQYRLGRGGQSVSQEGYFKHRLDHIKVSKRLFSFYNENRNKLSKAKQDYFLKHILAVSLVTYNIYMYAIPKDSNTRQEILEYDEWLLKNCPEYYDMVGQGTKFNHIKFLRKRKFKKVKLCKFILALKSRIGKLLGR